MTAYGDSLSIFDLRKPAIILSSALKSYSNPSKTSEDLNDFDLTQTPTGQTLLATCDDSGLSHVYSLDPSLTLHPLHTL